MDFKRKRKPIDDVTLSLAERISAIHAQKNALRNATSEDGFWKDPRTILGLLLTAIFSAVFAVCVWMVHENSYESGQRSVHEAACRHACGARMARYERLHFMRNVYRCACSDDESRMLVPVPSRLYIDPPRY